MHQTTSLPLLRRARATGSRIPCPRLTVNLFSGGKHAGGQVPIQDVLLIPLAATTIDESLAAAYEVYQTAADLILRSATGCGC